MIAPAALYRLQGGDAGPVLGMGIDAADHLLRGGGRREQP